MKITVKAIREICSPPGPPCLISIPPRVNIGPHVLTILARCGSAPRENYRRDAAGCCSSSLSRKKFDARDTALWRKILTKHEKALDKQARDVNAKLIEGNDIFRVALRGDAGRLVFSGEFTPLNIFAISLGSARVAGLRGWRRKKEREKRIGVREGIGDEREREREREGWSEGGRVETRARDVV